MAAASRGEGPIWRRTKVVAGSSMCRSGAFIGLSSYSPSCPARGGGGIVSSLPGPPSCERPRPPEFGFCGDLHLEEPGFTGGVGIDQRRLGRERLVDLDNFA